MIRISLGNVGSGKTANEVREMILKADLPRLVYTNIKMKRPELTPRVKLLTPKEIISEEVKEVKKKKDGTETAIMKKVLNTEFWKSLDEPVSVVLDEVHTIYDARRPTSVVNKCMNDFLALIRRVLGGASFGQGELVLISQLPFRIDKVAREMAHQVRYHVCHYFKTCESCFLSWSETSEVAEPLEFCPRCRDYKIDKHNHRIEIWHFKSMNDFLMWKEFGNSSFYKHYMVNDIESIFPLYDTLQWDNMFSEVY